MSFAGSKRPSGFAVKSPNKKAQTPSEPVTIIVCVHQIIKLVIPFQTPRAANIRPCMHTKIVTASGNKLFILS